MYRQHMVVLARITLLGLGFYQGSFLFLSLLLKCEGDVHGQHAHAWVGKGGEGVHFPSPFL